MTPTYVDGPPRWVPDQPTSQTGGAQLPQGGGGATGTAGSTPTPTGSTGVGGAGTGANQNINTSINPQPLYPPGFIGGQSNLFTALATPARGDIAAGWNRPGMSMNAGANQYGMGADWARQSAQAQMLGPQLAQTMQFGNLQHLLDMQTAREQEAQGWGQLGAQQQNLQNAWGTNQLQLLLNLLGQQWS